MESYPHCYVDPWMEGWGIWWMASGWMDGVYGWDEDGWMGFGF